MTDPDFPFEADVDVEAERAARGPIDRRQLVLTLVIAALGAVLVGIAGVLAVLEAAIAPGGLGAVLVTGAGPFAAWLVGAVLALVRLVRRGRRAWLPMLLGVAAAVVLAVIGVLWWLTESGLL